MHSHRVTHLFHVLKKTLKVSGYIIFGLYCVCCLILFLFQEKFIFHPEQLPPTYSFAFQPTAKEINIPITDHQTLNGLLFKTDSAKGLIFFLHGNAGSLRTWGNAAQLYTSLNYDVFMLDYRGYGKSSGSIESMEQLFQDNQTAYNFIAKHYSEKNIVILGHSIGTGMAAKLSADNHPQLLILQAPYYSLSDVMQQTFPIIPTFLLKYNFTTYRYLQKCKAPVAIFHGLQDEVIAYNSSLKLQNEFKPGDTLISLNGTGHNTITRHPDYKPILHQLLYHGKRK